MPAAVLTRVQAAFAFLADGINRFTDGVFEHVAGLVRRVLPERWTRPIPVSQDAIDRVYLAAYLGCIVILFLTGAPLWAFAALGVAAFLIGWWLDG